LLFLDGEIVEYESDYSLACFISEDILNKYAVLSVLNEVRGLAGRGDLSLIGRGHNRHQQIIMDAEGRVYGRHEKEFYLKVDLAFWHMAVSSAN